MKAPVNNNRITSIVIAAIIIVVAVLAWCFGGSISQKLQALMIPDESGFAFWKPLLIAVVGFVWAFLAEKFALKRLFPYVFGFILIWSIAGIITNNAFGFDLLVLPSILVTILTIVFIHLKKLWEIDQDLTDKLVSLGSTERILEGKSAELRIESGLKLLETIFPVSEVIVFRYELNGELHPIGRARKEKTHNSTSSRQDAWVRSVELCEQALKHRKTQIRKDENTEGAAQISIPLICDDTVIGVLFVDVRQDFEPEDRHLLESFSRQLARNFQRQELRDKKLPNSSWWDTFSTQSVENRLDITSMVKGIMREQSFSTVAGSYLSEAHAIAYLDGTIAYVNSQMRTLANLEEEEISSLDLFSLLDKFKTEVFNEPTLAIRRVMQTGDSYECDLHFPDEGKILGMQINLVKTSSESVSKQNNVDEKLPACFLINFRDVSAVKENEKLRSDMANLMSHELRTPITSIQGFAEVLLLEDGIPEDSKEFLNTIAAESQRAGKILTNFLSVANLQQSDKQEVIKTPVEVNNVVREVVDDYSKEAKQKRIRLVDRRSKTLPPVAADKGLIRKAISHLLDNAIRYSPERTSVMISTILETDFLRVEIEDRGYGIPKEEHEKIWQKFYRVAHDGQEKQEETTGLGLSLVKEIIEQHNGEVDVESVEGKGSRFTFRLPRF